MSQSKLLQMLACALIGYLIGSVNHAALVGRLKGYDPNTSGSGNPGASNTVIMAGKRAGALVALLDICKAAVSCWLAGRLFPMLRTASLIAGSACILGHMFSLFLHFHGGKGLACLGGVVLAYDPKTLLILLGIAVLIAVVTNYICIATTTMAAVWPLWYGVATGFWLGAGILAVPFVPILMRHMENFRRIRRGEELGFNFLWNRAAALERIGRSEDE